MGTLGLLYDVVLFDEREAGIVRRLGAGVPSLFWLWSPNPIIALFNVSRIQLPAYAPACFNASKCDYPTEIVEKVVSAKLIEIAPIADELIKRFKLVNAQQEQIMALAQQLQQPLSVFDATCRWVRENPAEYESWLPPPIASCDNTQARRLCYSSLASVARSLARSKSLACTPCSMAVRRSRHAH
jgi:hypothetical protein